MDSSEIALAPAPRHSCSVSQACLEEADKLSPANQITRLPRGKL